MTPTLVPLKPSPASEADNRRCRYCGCTTDHACVDPTTLRRCEWSTFDLCTKCEQIIGDLDEFFLGTRAGKRQVRVMLEELLARNTRLKR